MGDDEGFSMEMTFTTVNPEILTLLTGGLIGESPTPTPTFAIEIWSDIPWTWKQWQWWLQHTLWRRPKYKHRIVIPNARMAAPSEFPETTDRKDRQ